MMEITIISMVVPMTVKLKLDTIVLEALQMERMFVLIKSLVSFKLLKPGKFILLAELQ